ncbi:hypothetical protein [Williamsia muralis]|uniref:hypothetical protein n=1 Tax=Williamsia marianensis TaxID=85044 RepID=UPI00382EA60A
MYVVTIDQRHSRREADRVPHALQSLTHIPVIRPFDRTAGDEFQAVLDDPAAVIDTVLTLAEEGGWSIGVGIGTVELPLPSITRAGRGLAFERARDAVNAAKTNPYSVAVVGPDPMPCTYAQTGLRLLVRTVAGRSDAGHAAARQMRSGQTQSVAAATLGITPQALSQRLRAADWYIEEETRLLAIHLLQSAHS